MNKLIQQFKIGFLGDIHFGPDRPELAPELQAILLDCDIVIANLESPICEPSPIEVPAIIPSTREKKTILLRSELGSENLLSTWGIRYVTIANNHIFDHGDVGFKTTCERLRKQGIEFTGAGETLAEAQAPIILDTDIGKIGLIAATEERAQSFIATDSIPGCNTLDKVEIIRQIQILKAQVDHVVVSAHWGYCGPAYPPHDILTPKTDCTKHSAPLKPNPCELGSHCSLHAVGSHNT